MSEKDHKYIINQIKCRLVVSEPFFGHLLSSLTLLPNDNISKLQTYGNKIYYNKKYVKDTRVDILTNQLLHCIMHIAFNHFVRRRSRNNKAWDKACDIAINNILQYENNKTTDGITDSKQKGKSAETIYESVKLEKDIEKYVGAFDEHIDTYDREAEEETIRNVVEAHAVAKIIGKMPGGINELIKDLLEPKISWKELLRKYATECLTSEDYSFINPRKCLLPYGIYCASLISEADTLSQLSIIVDTSGSISSKELKEFFAEISALHYLSERTTVITCDSVIHDVYTLNVFDKLDKIKFSGRGGTDLTIGFDYLKKHKINPSLLVVLTDLYTPFPKKEPKFPVIWVSTEKNQKAPWGTTLYMDKES